MLCNNSRRQGDATDYVQLEHNADIEKGCSHRIDSSKAAGLRANAFSQNYSWRMNSVGAQKANMQRQRELERKRKAASGSLGERKRKREGGDKEREGEKERDKGRERELEKGRKRNRQRPK